MTKYWWVPSALLAVAIVPIAVLFDNPMITAGSAAILVVIFIGWLARTR